MISDFINILGEDKSTNAVFLQATSGSIVLDGIPSAINLLQVSKKYKIAHFRDYVGHIMTFDKTDNVETAIIKWENMIRNGAPESQVDFDSAEELQYQNIWAQI